MGSQLIPVLALIISTLSFFILATRFIIDMRGQKRKTLTYDITYSKDILVSKEFNNETKNFLQNTKIFSIFDIKLIKMKIANSTNKDIKHTDYITPPNFTFEGTVIHAEILKAKPSAILLPPHDILLSFDTKNVTLEKMPLLHPQEWLELGILLSHFNGRVDGYVSIDEGKPLQRSHKTDSFEIAYNLGKTLLWIGIIFISFLLAAILSSFPKMKITYQYVDVSFVTLILLIWLISMLIQIIRLSISERRRIYAIMWLVTLPFLLAVLLWLAYASLHYLILNVL